jgi:hypothetical protein
VSTDAAAASAPLTLDLINPSRLSLRSTRTFWILANSSPSSAAKLKIITPPRKTDGASCVRTVVAEVVHQDDLLDQMFRTPVEHAGKNAQALSRTVAEYATMRLALLKTTRSPSPRFY